MEKDKKAQHIQELWRDWFEVRKEWDVAAREDVDFYLGNHYSSKEVDELNSRNQSSTPLDRLYASIEQFKAIITSKPPKFSAIGREDSDNKLANVWRTILEYIWDLSDGNETFKQVVHDYAVTGLGYFYAYIDNEDDYGRGEVKFTYVDPFRVVVDPNSRNRWYDDASGVMLSTILTKLQLIDLYPQLAEQQEDGKMLIDLIESTYDDETYPDATNQSTVASFTPDVIKDKDRTEGSEKYQLIEYFHKIKVPYYRIVDLRQQGKEQVVNLAQLKEMMLQSEMKELMTSGVIDIVEVLQNRIRLTCTLGEIILYEKLLDCDKYPIIPVPNIWTNTPYPMSDVRKNKSYQKYLNKIMSLITSHAQASAGLKLLIPQGSIDDIEELERDWANPNATIEYDPSMGEPHFPSPQPLSSSILGLPKMIEGYMDLNMGIFEMMQGNSEAAPRTSSATMMMEDFGQRRSKSKLRDIEGSLKRLGQMVYSLAKSHYTFEKTFRIVQPNNDINEYTVNKRLYDDKSQQLMSIQNELSMSRFDIRVIGSSTMPSNKWGEWQIYMEAFQAGLIDRHEALKKTEIFDKEGVMQRTDILEQLQQQLQGAQEKIKELSGDLQTANRESVQSRKRTEVEKFKSTLKETELRGKYKGQLETDKLTNAVKLENERLRLSSQTQIKKEKS